MHTFLNNISIPINVCDVGSERFIIKILIKVKLYIIRLFIRPNLKLFKHLKLKFVKPTSVIFY